MNRSARFRCALPLLSLLGFSSAIALICAVWSGPAAVAGETKQRVTQDANSVTVLRNDQEVLKYRSTDVPFKPYVKELFTPGGVQILRDSPHDHKHHHGLMFAVAVNGVDFWAEVKTCGREISRAMGETKSSAQNSNTLSSFTQQLDWLAPDDARLLQEQRTITVWGGPDIPATLLTWRSRLATPAGKEKVTLSGSHYFGLGMRFVESMDLAGRFFNSEGKEGEVVRGSERITPARWCAYVSSANGKPVTVALFDHPQNVRHPAYFFTMRPFAYLGATLHLKKEPLELHAAEPLDLRYGVALWDGEIDAAQVEALYRKWTKMEP
jgi:hypothetical protein